MATQIKPSVTNPTIADIYEKIESKRLDISPDFQRKFVWTLEHQEQFLDTILHGYPSTTRISFILSIFSLVSIIMDMI